MGDLQATIEFLVELYKFYNVDLFIRGYYQLRFTFKPPKSSHAVQVEVYDGHDENGTFSLFPAFITEDGQTAASRTFNIYYKDEEVLLKDVFLFRVHLLIDSTKAADCIEKTALEMSVDVHFTDQVVRVNNYQTLPMVTSRTLKFHLSCFNGLHHQVPLLFDYYYFSVVDLIIHANIVSLGLPNWSILKPLKTGWFSKSTPARTSPMFFNTLFGNRYQLGTQFYSDASLKYALPSSSVTRECFEKASAIHRNLCAILAMAHSKLLNYFEEMMQYLDEKQRIELGDKLDPADLVEGLSKKLETLQSCEELFDEICSDLAVLNNELSLLWFQFQESFVLNDKIRPILREQHQTERMLHFSEAFFVHELPWKSLLNATDSSAQKHANMGQCVKTSRYLSLIPPVTVECADVDGDSSSIPIFFEDRYVSTKEASTEEVAIHVSENMLEDELLEHKSLSPGILNEAFLDGSSNGNVGVVVQHEDVTGEEWVDIKAGKKDVEHVTSDEGSTNPAVTITGVVDDGNLNGATKDHCLAGVEDRLNIAQTGPTACHNCPQETSTDDEERNCGQATADGETHGDLSAFCLEEDRTTDVEAQQGRSRSNEDLRIILEADDAGASEGNQGTVGDEGDDNGGTFFEDIMARISEVLSDGHHGLVADDRGEGAGELGLDKPAEDFDSAQAASEKLRTSVDVETFAVRENGEVDSADTSLDGTVDVDSLHGNTGGSGKAFDARVSQLAGIATCDTENWGDCGAASENDVETLPANAEGGVVGEHEIGTRETGSICSKMKSDDLVETRCDEVECNENITQGANPEAERTSGSEVPREDCQGSSSSSGHLTCQKKVSNSVFYERTWEPRRNSEVVSQERELSEQFLGISNLPNSAITSVRLSNSSSSADTVGCFCGGKLEMTSSPYRPGSEIEKTNLKLQNAKQEAKARINYCGTLYSDLDSEFLVRPYFMDPKPDLSLEPVHFVVCVHGLDGNSGDLRLLRCFLEMTLPSTKFEFLMSEINQDNTFLPFEQLTEKLVSEILHHMEAYRVVPSRISFIGHSLGNIIIRSALTHPLMEPYVARFHTFLSLSGPHLGMIYHTSSLVSTGLWLMQKWKKSASLLQLSLNDSTDMRDSFLYKLSKKKGLEYFTNILLVSSVQDHYVPFHSARIEMPKILGRSNSQECSLYREMIENILTPLLSKPNRTLVRYSVYHCLPSSTNSFIGRAAHIAMLDSELFIEKLICRSTVKYFQ